MENFDKIEDYLLDKMPIEERKIFEEELKNNNELAIEVELHKLGSEAIELMQKNELREKIKSIHTEAMSNLAEDESYIKKDIPIVRRRNLYLVASIAATLVLFVSAILFFAQGYSNSNIQLLGLELEDPILTKGIRKGEPSNKQFDQQYIYILKMENKKRAEDAINYFKQFSEEDKTLFPQAQFNLAFAYLINDDYTNAIDIFQKIQSPSQLKESAQYYQSLCYIGSDNEAAAKILLNEIISDPGHDYIESSQLLLDKLNSFWRVF